MFNPIESAINSTPTQSLSPVLTDDKAISHLINQLLGRSGLTQAELAARLGVKPQSVAQYQNQRRKQPSIQWLVKLVLACGGRIWVEFPTTPVKPYNPFGGI